MPDQAAAACPSVCGAVVLREQARHILVPEQRVRDRVAGQWPCNLGETRSCASMSLVQDS